MNNNFVNKFYSDEVFLGIRNIGGIMIFILCWFSYFFMLDAIDFWWSGLLWSILFILIIAASFPAYILTKRIRTFYIWRLIYFITPILISLDISFRLITQIFLSMSSIYIGGCTLALIITIYIK